MIQLIIVEELYHREPMFSILWVSWGWRRGRLWIFASYVPLDYIVLQSVGEASPPLPALPRPPHPFQEPSRKSGIWGHSVDVWLMDGWMNGWQYIKYIKYIKYKAPRQQFQSFRYKGFFLRLIFSSEIFLRSDCWENWLQRKDHHGIRWLKNDFLKYVIFKLDLKIICRLGKQKKIKESISD